MKSGLIGIVCHQMPDIGSIRNTGMIGRILPSFSNEAHLRRLLRSYVASTTARARIKRWRTTAPFPRAVQPPSRGWMRAVPEVGGLHHRYQRVA
jgi:hypothetical protein